MTTKPDAPKPEEAVSAHQDAPSAQSAEDASAQGHQADQAQQAQQAQQASGEQDSGEQASLDPIQTLKEALLGAQAQAQEQNEQMLRAQAEMENVRRRAQEEVAKARKFGIESFAEALVPVKDSLEAALAQEDQSLEVMREGIQTTLKQLSAAFERNHLGEIDPEPGTKFDPNHHQAIATVPAEQQSNTVVTVLQKGYLIADRVLRPALVTVAS